MPMDIALHQTHSILVFFQSFSLAQFFRVTFLEVETEIAGNIDFEFPKTVLFLAF